MFEQSLMETAIGKTKTSWAVLASFALQMLLVGVAILIPLLNYAGLPATELMTFLVAPPPPPPPPPPPVTVKVKVIPREFDAGKLIQPVDIPEDVAIFEEAAAPVASIAGVVGGVPGGAFGGSLGGVIGGIISSTPMVAPPPPPVKKKPPPPPKRIRVGGSVQRANLIRQVRPVYPPAGSPGQDSGHCQADRHHRQGRNHRETGSSQRSSAADSFCLVGGKAVALQTHPAQWAAGGSCDPGRRQLYA